MDAQNIKPKRGYQLRVHLIIFGLICFLPAFIAVWLVGWNLARAEQHRVEAQALRIAQDFSGDIDGEIAMLTKALQALSSSPALEARDFARFRAQAVTVAADNDATIALRDLSGRHIVNTLQPYGTAPAATTTDPVLREADRRAIATGRPVATDLYTGAVGRRFYVTVDLPIIENGAAAYLLSMAVTPERIIAKLDLGALAQEGWLAAVVGSDGRVLARTRDFERFAGRPATGDLAAAIKRQPQGALRSVTLDGVAVHTVFQAGRQGWTTVVSVPEDVLRAPVDRLYVVLALVGALVLGTTLVGAWGYGRLIGSELATLAENALRISSHRPLKPFSLTVSEVAAAQRAFAQASEKSDQLLRELDHRVKNTLSVVQSIALRTVSDKQEQAALAGRIAALSRAHEALSEARWEAVPLEALLRAVASSEDAALATQGPPVLLPARTATCLAQVWQELCANARQHGALTRPEGKVEARWEIAGGMLRFVWKESASSVPMELRPGFGLKIVELGVVRQLNGTVSVSPAPEGWSVTVEVPLRSELGVAVIPVGEDGQAEPSGRPPA